MYINMLVSIYRPLSVTTKTSSEFPNGGRRNKSVQKSGTVRVTVRDPCRKERI